MTIRVFMVDDHALVRQGFRRILEEEPGLSVVGEAGNAQEGVALLLVDQRMPGMTGTELLTASRRLYPDARRVLLTAYADTDAAIRAIETAAFESAFLASDHHRMPARIMTGTAPAKAATTGPKNLPSSLTFMLISASSRSRSRARSPSGCGRH